MVSDRLMELFRSATPQGPVPDATHRGAAGEPGCRPDVVVSFRAEDGVIRKARSQTYGCPTSVACVEIVCRISEGRLLSLFAERSPRDLSLLVGGVPEGKAHVPELVVRALARIAPVALDD